MVLLLIPTSYEANILLGEESSSRLSAREPVRVQLEEVEVLAGVCGFGVAASGVIARHMIERSCRVFEKPQRVVLAGIAGAYLPELCPGSSIWGTEIRCDGIGVGGEEEFTTAEQLGWEQIPGESTSLLPLTLPAKATAEQVGILTVTSASHNRERASRRAAEYPESGVEEMEGYSVALAGRLSEIPVSILRGISNIAGDRDRSGWMVEAALSSVRRELISVLREEDSGGR